MATEEPRNGGESADTERSKHRLARMLEANGHGDCAYDLEAADDSDLPEIAYQIAEHIEEACGDFHDNPELARKVREWADQLE